MCLLVLARNRHPDYPLVVVANRDEYFDRPAEPAGWWQANPNIMGGRDLRAGGTWMGLDRGGRWGAVTNYRDGNYEPAPCSRGDLVTQYLVGSSPPEAYLTDLVASANQYQGFNVIVGDRHGVYCFSNRREGVQSLGDGIFTLSNHLLDTPWPKSELARLKLNRLLHKTPLKIDALFSVLADSQPFDDHELPVTGVGIEMERALSPPFIRGDHYGTRCTTVLLVDKNGNLTFAEQSFLPNGEKGSLSRVEFSLDVVGG